MQIVTVAIIAVVIMVFLIVSPLLIFIGIAGINYEIVKLSAEVADLRRALRPNPDGDPIERAEEPSTVISISKPAA